MQRCFLTVAHTQLAEDAHGLLFDRGLAVTQPQGHLSVCRTLTHQVKDLTLTLGEHRTTI